MSLATISISDGSEGQINVAVTYEDGFIPESEACQLAHVTNLQISRWLDAVGPEAIIGNAPSGRVTQTGTTD